MQYIDLRSLVGLDIGRVPSQPYPLEGKGNFERVKTRSAERGMSGSRFERIYGGGILIEGVPVVVFIHTLDKAVDGGGYYASLLDQPVGCLGIPTKRADILADGFDEELAHAGRRVRLSGLGEVDEERVGHLEAGSRRVWSMLCKVTDDRAYIFSRVLL